MSAALIAPEAELRLRAKAAVQLSIRLSSYGDLCVALYPRNIGKTISSLAYANQKISECRLDTEPTRDRYSLWVGCAAFDVTRTEAAEIHALLAPWGLRSKFENEAAA